MLLDNVILPGIVYPAVAAILALVLSTLFARGGIQGRSGASLALAAALVTGFVGLFGWPRWPPVEATQRLVVFVAVFGFAAFVVTLFKTPEPTRKLSFAGESSLFTGSASLATFFVVLVLASLALLETLVRHSWGLWQSAAWVAAVAIGGALFWLRLRSALSTRSEAPNQYPGHSDSLSSILLRIVALGLLAAVLGLAESALLGQLMGALVIAVAVIDVAGFLLRRRFWRAGDLGTLSLAIAGLLLIAHHYAGLSLWPAIFTVVALLLLAPARAPLWRDALPLLPLLIAVGLLIWAKTNEPDPYDYYGAEGSVRAVETADFSVEDPVRSAERL